MNKCAISIMGCFFETEINKNTCNFTTLNKDSSKFEFKVMDRNEFLYVKNNIDCEDFLYKIKEVSND